MPEDAKKTKILIVEDDEFLLNIYVTTFTNAGFEVLSAANGKDGLKLAFNQLPSVILLDILLPGGKTGIDVLQEIKSNPATAKIPVMIMSNLADDMTISEGMAMGAKGYFPKAQFNPDDVVRNIRNLI